MLDPSPVEAVLVLPVFIGTERPRAGDCGTGSPGGGGYKRMISPSVPPVRPDAEEALEDGLEPPIAGMALEAARVAILLLSPARAGPYELLPLVELLL